jgi:hypothetical protein
MLFATGAPTVKKLVIPPVLNPVASDIESTNSFPSIIGNCGIEYEP